MQAGDCRGKPKEIVFKEWHGLYLLRRERQRQEQNVQLPCEQAVDQAWLRSSRMKSLKAGDECVFDLADQEEDKAPRWESPHPHTPLKRGACPGAEGDHVLDVDQQISGSLDNLLAQERQNTRRLLRSTKLTPSASSSSPIPALSVLWLTWQALAA